MSSRKIMVFLLSLVFITGLAGCKNPGTPASAGKLVILVLGEDQEPLSGAKVVSGTEPEGQLKVTGLTRADGSVKFNDIKAGAYGFYINRFDYGQEEFQVTVAAGITITKTAVLHKLQYIP